MKPHLEAMAPPSAAMRRLRVHYIRHGESQWNAAQKSARNDGMDEPSVRALADEARFTDSPLSVQGISQALLLRSLQQQHGEDEASSSTDGLFGLLVCASGLTCPAPSILVSNLRRAIDTCLYATRPLLDARHEVKITVVPALQETCHHADCMPLPLRSDGGIEHPTASGTTSRNDSASDPITASVLAAQAQAIETVVEAADAQWLWEVGYSRLTLSKHAGAYDDRRRIPDGLRLRAAAELSDPDFAEAFEPLTRRLGDVFTAAFEDIAAARSERHPVIITAHSRLLRELIYMFRSNRLQATVAGIPNVALRWDASTNSEVCASISYDTAKLNNCGFISFDIDLEVVERCTPVNGEGCRKASTLFLRHCVMGQGSVVLSRRVPSLSIAAAPSPPTRSLGNTLLFFCVLLALAVLVVRRVRSPRRSRHD